MCIRASLYAEHDHLTSLQTVTRFAETHNAHLTILEGGEHWFHTESQLTFLDCWMQQALGSDLSLIHIWLHTETENSPFGIDRPLLTAARRSRRLKFSQTFGSLQSGCGHNESCAASFWLNSIRTVSRSTKNCMAASSFAHCLHPVSDTHLPAGHGHGAGARRLSGYHRQRACQTIFGAGATALDCQLGNPLGGCLLYTSIIRPLAPIND